MKRKHFLFAIALLASVIPSFGEIHAGFRKAIDKGDITTAINLRKAGVTDIYCPESMSPGNAVKLYEDELRNSPEILIKNCEPGFFAKIGPMACSNPKNAKLCKQVLKATPVSKWEAILDKIIEKDIHNYVDSTCVKNRHHQAHNECNVDFTDEMNHGLSFEFKKIQSNPLKADWTQPMLMDKMKVIASTASNSPVEITDPYKDYKAVAIYPSKENYRMESGCFADDSCSAEVLTKRFVEFSDIPDDMGLFFCHLNPEIGHIIETKKGLNILDCESLFTSYSHSCSEKNEGKIRGIPLDQRQFRCQKKDSIWNWIPFGIKVGKTIWALKDNRHGGTANKLRATFTNIMKAKYVEKNEQALQSNEEKLNYYLRNVTGDLRGGKLSYYNVNFSATYNKDVWYDYWKDYFSPIGNHYDFKEAEQSCPNGWSLPTQKQFDELAKTIGNGLANAEAVPKHSDKWKFSLRELITVKESKSFIPEVSVDPYVMWLADGNQALIWPWDDSVTYKSTKSKKAAYVRCVMDKQNKTR